MGARERRKRALDLVVDDSECITVAEGSWYRRGPPCPVCEDHSTQGVIFDGAAEDGRESCAVCTALIDVRDYGARQTGTFKVIFPPDTDDLARNPYLNPLPSWRDFEPQKDLTPVENAVRSEYEWRASFVAAGHKDVGNGRRMARMWEKRIRYTSGWGWLVYDGRRWLRDDIGTIHRLAKATLEEGLRILHETKSDFWDNVQSDYGADKKSFQQEIQASFSSGKVEAMVRMAQSEPGVVARAEDFDQEPWLVNCKNGIVDLMGGTLRPHTPELYFSKLIPHDYPAPGTTLSAACPRWEKFLDEFTCHNEELRDFLQRLAGYTLTGETKEQKLIFLYGDGANGKSTFLEVLRFILDDYSIALSFETLLKSRNAKAEEGFASLPGKRFATAIEAGEARSWNEEAIKSVTGGDTVRGKFLYEDSFEFRPVAKIWVAANERPRIDGVNEGIWRRFLLIPCLANIPPERRDPGLLEALKAEAPGILAWCVRGSMRWYREGLRNPPECVANALQDYREDNDSLARFVEETCDLAPDLNVGATDLYKAYKQYAKELGEPELTQTRFGARLAKWRGGVLRKSRMPGGKIRWNGIGLRFQQAQEDAFRAGLGAYDRP